MQSEAGVCVTRERVFICERCAAAVTCPFCSGLITQRPSGRRLNHQGKPLDRYAATPAGGWLRKTHHPAPCCDDPGRRCDEGQVQATI